MSRVLRLQEFEAKQKASNVNAKSQTPPPPPPSPPILSFVRSNSGSNPNIQSAAAYSSCSENHDRMWQSLEQSVQTMEHTTSMLASQIEKIGATLDQVTHTLKFCSDMLSRRIDAETHLIYRRLDKLAEVLDVKTMVVPTKVAQDKISSAQHDVAHQQPPPSSTSTSKFVRPSSLRSKSTKRV